MMGVVAERLTRRAVYRRTPKSSNTNILPRTRELRITFIISNIFYFFSRKELRLERVSAKFLDRVDKVWEEEGAGIGRGSRPEILNYFSAFSGPVIATITGEREAISVKPMLDGCLAPSSRINVDGCLDDSSRTNVRWLSCSF